MILHTLSLEGFRNYERQRVEFAPEVNVITGDNAQGKTNLLEAICCLTDGKPFRARSDREAIGFGRDAAWLDAAFTAQGREQTISITYARDRRRQIQANGVRLRSAADLAGKLRAVLFCPEDLEMIRSGAAVRRRLLDDCLCQMRPRYAQLLSAYNRTLDQKSRILKEWRELPSLLEPLEEYNDRLTGLSAELIHYRARLVQALQNRANPIHGEFSGGKEELGLTYKTVSTVEDPLAPVSDLAAAVAEHQRTHRQAELDSSQCLTGAHKDDILIRIGELDAKTYASQGQTRTAALSVKLAQRELLRDDGGEMPLLLLDDVLSELDGARRSFVLNRIGGGQVFITCCNEEETSRLAAGKVLHVQAGVIS